jgi:hypothetical protein
LRPVKADGNNGTDEKPAEKDLPAKSGHSSVNPSASPTCPEKSRSSNLTFHLFHCSRLTGIFSLSCQNFNFLPRQGQKTNQWFSPFEVAARGDSTAKTPRQPDRQMCE